MRTYILGLVLSLAFLVNSLNVSASTGVLMNTGCRLVEYTGVSMTLCYSTGPLEGTQPPTIPIVTVPPTPNYDYPHACLDINFPERWNPVCAPWIQPSETLREGLINTNWSIVSMNGTMISTPATLDFGTRTMQVSICNSLIGSYHAIKNKLFTQRFISTRIYCENDGMAVENAMRHATRSHASISGDILTLHTREGNIIIWQRR